MAQVTYYVALPFVTDDGVATCEPLEAAQNGFYTLRSFEDAYAIWICS